MRNSGYILFLLFFILMFSCDKKNDSVDYLPEASFIISPDTGNTTTVFKFDASSSLENSLEDNPVFLRWDWDGDGTFDKMYTSGGNYTHRFYKKGNYTVVLEAATLLGRKDTAIINLTIPQGYSSPHPDFFVTPDSANIKTEFVFDASLSKDDEDSLAQLQFRWDFEGDDVWDTEFISEPQISHVYDDNKYYAVKLEVKDPQGMTAAKVNELIVTRYNSRITPRMTMECWPCTLEDTIHFDASQSFHQDKPEEKLLYSWDIFNDNYWEMVNSESPLFAYRIPSEGVKKIKLRVTDSEGLYMDSLYELEIFPYNTPPMAQLVLANPYGNTGSHYYLHTLESWDRETSFFDLEIRWDLDGDGIWEEEHNDQREVWTYYDQTGKYPITLKMTDEQGKSTTKNDTIYVFAGDRQTGILEDKRSWIPQYYGTVLIGDKWWTQNNSRYVPPQGFPLPPGSYYVFYYGQDTDSVENYWNQREVVYKYGFLYPYQSLFSTFSPCPDGWRIPTVDDWEQLIENLAPRNNISDLLFGGSSELHIHLAGHLQYNVYSQRGRSTEFYTKDRTAQGHPYLWYIDKLLNKNKSVIGNRSYYLPMRCVKDN